MAISAESYFITLNLKTKIVKLFRLNLDKNILSFCLNVDNMSNDITYLAMKCQISAS